MLNSSFSLIEGILIGFFILAIAIIIIVDIIYTMRR